MTDLLKNCSRKGESDLINGVSEINQKFRHNLGITCDEYVLLDILYKLEVKKEPLTFDYTYRKLGLSTDETKSQIKSLMTKGYVTLKDKMFFVYDQWKKLFSISEGEFETFWVYKGKVYWTGSKPDAKKKYTECRKNYSAEYLLNQRDGYFALLELQKDWRQVMGASVFLNPKTERFRENFYEQIKRIKPVIQKEEQQLTAEKSKKLFE